MCKVFCKTPICLCISFGVFIVLIVGIISSSIIYVLTRANINIHKSKLYSVSNPPHLHLSNGEPGKSTSIHRTFHINDSGIFKDGEEFQYVSGSIHYSRIPREYWFDRLYKCKEAGLDAIQVYVMWNVHQPRRPSSIDDTSSSSSFDFTGDTDLVDFLKTAATLDLLVILRPGPYVCAEWDYGGLPAWILKDQPNLAIRTNDPAYFELVTNWFNVLLPMMVPLLYHNGGPIIMVQIENEYGSFSACDYAYTDSLTSLVRSHLGTKVQLFTTDGNNLPMLKCGAVPGVFSTVDFGVGNASRGFEVMRTFNNNTGPLINSEFYAGWLDVWGGSHANVSITATIDSMQQMIQLKASFNIYMFVGGTNFGYMNGCENGGQICTTSYDYDAPISESGALTSKYYAIQTLLLKSGNSTPKQKKDVDFEHHNVTNIQMKYMAGVLDCVPFVGGQEVTTKHPLSMEQLDQNYGFVLYKHKLKKTYANEELSIPGVRDRGYVFINKRYCGMVTVYGCSSLNVVALEGDLLYVFVENQGRINYGSGLMNNTKGIVSAVKFGGQELTDWTSRTMNFDRLSSIMSNATYQPWPRFEPDDSPSVEQNGPAIYSGQFKMTNSDDVFLDLESWFKL